MTSFQVAARPSWATPLFALPIDAPEVDRRITVAKGGEKYLDLAMDWRMTPRWRMQYGLTLVGDYAVPRIEPTDLVPKKLIVFSEAIRMKVPDEEAWVHFYEDDVKFERIWQEPEKYLKILKRFSGIIAPDASLYENMVEADKIENTRRNYLFGAWAQRKGLNVIANVRLSGIESVGYALAGTPQHSVLAVSINGSVRDKRSRARTVQELRVICNAQQPTGLVVYGSDSYGVLDSVQEAGIQV